MKSKKLYACSICGLRYQDKPWAEKCEEWCKNHSSCSLEIARHAVNLKK
ncbi:MAG: hypothetical protein HYW25_01645 [Candidatus Aenigmarchaeota archaeon]|nr:hypothetical protein [Candidatus Aenigmarchaeota archaeon]